MQKRLDYQEVSFQSTPEFTSLLLVIALSFTGYTSGTWNGAEAFKVFLCVHAVLVTLWPFLLWPRVAEVLMVLALLHGFTQSMWGTSFAKWCSGNVHTVEAMMCSGELNGANAAVVDLGVQRPWRVVSSDIECGASHRWRLPVTFG